MNSNRNLKGESFVLLAILLGIVAVFFFSNVSTVLTHFGFETKEMIRAQLVREQEQKAIIAQENKQLSESLIKEQIATKEALKQVQELHAWKDNVREVTHSVTQAKQKKVSPQLTRLSQIKPEPVVTQYDADVLEVSKANIESITVAYHKLFQQPIHDQVL